jgi:predicted DsbA family dithiol-disulfide isomerase
VLVLFHDYTSPESAVAVMRLHRLMREGIPAEVRGIEVLGLDATVPVTVDVIAALDAVAGEAAAEGLTMRRPPALPPTGLAHVVEDVARAHGLDMAWREHCYEAFWSEGTDISNPDELRRIAERADLPSADVDRALEDRVALLAVRRRAAGDRHNGIGGVPTILYDRTLVPGLLPEADLRTLAALGPST